MLLADNDITHLELKIAAAERLTTAEFKVIITKSAWFGIRKKAMRIFKKYNLHKTSEQNAVMLLVFENSKQLLIYGDEGIHAKVGSERWEIIRDEVLKEFKKNEFTEGLGLGIHLIVDSLAEHFPAKEKQINEVSNEIIFEN